MSKLINKGSPLLLSIVIVFHMVMHMASAQGSPTQSAPATDQGQVKLGQTLEIKYDPKSWLYYKPKFLKSSGISVFESSTFPKLHAFLRTEPSDFANADSLQQLCNQLAVFPLSSTDVKKGTGTLLKIGKSDVCRVNKSDDEQVAVQYIFFSRSAPGRATASGHATPKKYYTHYLYFYYPKALGSQPQSTVSQLVQGLREFVK